MRCLIIVNFWRRLAANDPDAEVKEDNNELQEKYEAFRKVQEISNEIIGIYKDKIFKDIGVKIDKAEFQAVETYINKQVFDNPKEIEKLASQVKEYQEAPDRISQKEQEIEELTGGKDLKETLKDLREQRMQLMDESNRLGTSKEEKEKALEDKNKKIFIKRWFSGGSNKTRKKEISSLEGDIAGVNFSSEKLGEQIKDLEDADKLRKEIKKEADGAREKLFSNFEPIEEIATRAREKANEKFSMLVKEGELKKLEEAKKFLEHLQGLSGGKEWNNYAEGLEKKQGMGLSEIQESLDYMIEGAIIEEFEKSVDNFKIGDRPLEKMEKVLKPLLNKSEIGSKDIKDFMVETLSDISKNLPQKDMRKFLLNHIIGKLERGFYDTAI